MKHANRNHRILFALALAFSLSSPVVLADGTETLGPFAVDVGTDIIGDGVGLVDGPDTLTVDIPDGLTVEKVLLYWNGFHSLQANGVNTIIIEGPGGGGQQAINGSLIGGPTLFFMNNYSSTYRADITGLGLIPGPGSYDIEVTPFGAGFDQANNGASVIVIATDPSKTTNVQLADGQDLAYRRFAEPLRTTVPQTFNFAAAAQDRFMTLTFLAGSVQGSASTGGVIRPNIVDVTVGGDTTRFGNPFDSFTGDEWDHVCNSPLACKNVVSPLLDIVIPAGATSVTIEAISAGFCSNDVATACLQDAACDGGTCLIAAPNEPKPASFVWIATGMSIRIPTCGDGIVDPGEECDDGNDIDDDECSNECLIPACGNGTVDPQNGETCDPPGDPAGANGNVCRGDCTVCGDGVVDAGEDCDDANNVDSDACGNDCKAPVCGDGTVDPQNNETCELPGDPAGANDNVCRDDCTVCGDGVVDAGEDCDDANTDDGDACGNDCKAPVCGDGTIDPQNNETCEQPGDPAGANDNVCRDDCTVCGDGVVDAGEDCDDANTDDGDACGNDCKAPVCGDGTVDPQNNETCELPGDPAGANDNVCRDDCTVCGDGVVDAGEDCDDANTDDGDACGNDCKAPVCGDGTVDSQNNETCELPGDPAGANDNVCRDDCTVCGDGVVDASEDCDDANSDNADACRNDCSMPRCGDGLVDAADGETCELPGDPAGANDNVCRDDCTVCGDGVVDAGEDCDDANTDDGDACGNDCKAPVCGDGTIDPQNNETCEQPGDPAGANDNVCRDDCTVCGDGVVDAGEDCDDANTDDGDACGNDCKAPVCGDGTVDPQNNETCELPGDPAGANDNVCRDDCTVCGDGVVDAGEDCDDANTDDGDACGNDCKAPVCGDGTVDPQNNETCELPGDPAGANDNVCRDDCTVCGDGVVDAGEDCDDANSDNADACRNDCSMPRCGDGLVDAADGETCDPPGDPAGANGNTCRGDCTVCGDGVVGAGEDCDDGNSDNADACRNDCSMPRCGDSVVESADGETCDPPGDPAGANDNVCRDDCTVCGDGVVDAGEDCDDANTDDGDACGNDCKAPVCGDGTVDPQNNETCELPGDPAGANDNVCRDDCTVCGDGVVDAGEDCDDANTDDGDACGNDCKAPVCGDGTVDPQNNETCELPGDPAGANGNTCRGDCTVCGDGVVDAGEDCDDANTDDGDACGNDCKAPVCGDGTVDPQNNESCELPGDPAGANGNTCRGDCTVCGDGVVDAGEDCDDGNSDNADACRNDCSTPRCGDGLVDDADGETCDPPGDPAGASGNDCRDNCTVCGDGVVDAGEDCDDGNNDNTDTCRNDCSMPRCGDGLVDAADDETCDPPGDPAGANGNDCRDDCTVCGDGVVDNGEDCDDANGIDDDACRNNCTVPRCGDGVVDDQNDETCERPGDPAGANGNDCRDDCTVCGDGVVDSGEECDDGNSADFDDCNNDCVVPRCDAQLDKQISCDGGQTYVDTGFGDNAASSCIGWDGDAEIKVRYVVDTEANGSLVDCELIDSNGMVLGGAVDIGTLGGDLDEFVIWETSAIECSAELEAAEPNTATLSCECFEPGSGVNVTASDEADIQCQAVALEVSKDCGNQDPATDESPVTIRVSNPANPRGASLQHCEVIDELANYVSEPFTLAPGESRDFDLVVTGLTSPTLNIAWVHCDIVGAVGKRIVVDEHDLCRVCPDITLDKQISCDGGATYTDVGPDDGMAETCMGREGGENEIVVRYVANGMVNGYHSACEVVDSNGEILSAPRSMFGFPGAVFETRAKDCTAELEAGEPNTATLTCECYKLNSGIFISDTDSANIECASPECGDGVLDDDESCDPPGDPAGASGNDCRDDCTVCGDGVLDSSETCDDGNNVDDDGCRNDCSSCGDGQRDPGEDCDDGNTDGGDGCSPDCRLEELCDLEVVKTCIVPEVADGDDDDDDANGNDCDGRVVSMRLQYTGDGCAATTNDQSGQVRCMGGAGAAAPVSILITDRRGNEVYADEMGVFLGDVVEASNPGQTTGGPSRLGANTLVTIDDGAESVMFHTSCSQPLAVGDQFGSMLVVGMTTTGGGTVVLPPTMEGGGIGAETSECTIPATPLGPHCEGKVRSLGLRYLGGGCDASSNTQGDRAGCNGTAGMADPVRIRCFKDGINYLDTVDANVSAGDVVLATAANAGRTEFGSETRCEIYDDSGTWLQDLRFHTSCSRPLNLGDRFGALEVFSLDTTSGGTASLGTEVLYRYRITNHSAVNAEDVTAIDSELGELPGSPIASIAPDETVLLEASTRISETTTNTVSVTATLETGEVCDAVEDTATVTVEVPPVLQECTTKIDAMLLKYIGPDLPGPVTVEALPRTQSTPVVYEFPGGLANGTVVSSAAQNGFTVDPGVQGVGDAGSKTTIFINGTPEVHHTSCSTPYVSGLPAPLDSPKGDPSPNWFVVNFTQK